MRYTIDSFGRACIDGDGLFDVISQDIDPDQFIITMDEEIARYNDECQRLGKAEHAIIPNDAQPVELQERARTWVIPAPYQELDISKICLELCQSDDERARVQEEMAMFEKRNLVPLLKALVFCVDNFRQNGILWGVGRGSSVASYVLFLLGVHRINSMRYGLDIKEFLR